MLGCTTDPQDANDLCADLTTDIIARGLATVDACSAECSVTSRTRSRRTGSSWLVTLSLAAGVTFDEADATINSIVATPISVTITSTNEDATASDPSLIVETRSPTLAPTPAPTATHTISWGNDAVDAASITIGLGDTVRWVVDQQGGHNVVSGAAHGAPDGRFSSPWLANLNDEWTHTFDTAGRFSYYCDPHSWMVATILVEPCAGQPATSYCWGIRRYWGPEQAQLL